MSQTKGVALNYQTDSGVRVAFGGCHQSEADLKKLFGSKAISLQKIYLRLKQTHSADIFMLKSLEQLEESAEADGIFTKLPGVGLLIRTADCMPIHFSSNEERVTGLVHVGWRGLSNGILENAVSFYQSELRGNLEDLRVIIGPSIRKCCYEVGAEFEAKFGDAYFESPQSGKGMLDLQKNATERLRKLGLARSAIQDLEVCTCCDEGYYSYRRDKTEMRNLSVSCLS